MRGILFAICLLPLTLAAQTWCTPYVANATAAGSGVTNVVMGSISNTSSAQTATGAYYSDYSSKYTARKQGLTQSFSITVGSTATKVTIYIDWNNDGDFADAGESLFTGTGTSTTLSSSFTVPLTAKSGVKRLRISADGSAGPAGSCTNLQGEFEDYSFVVLDSSIYSPNIGAGLILSPAQRFTLSANTVTLKAHNLDPDTSISSFSIGYSINGTTIATQNISGGSVNLRPALDTTISFGTTYTPSGMGTCTLRVWAEKPNGGGTGKTLDDTVTRILAMCNSLSGNYTIDPAGSGSTNFRSFADAWFYLSSCGVSGPVVISVAPGTYTERINLSNISGLSATNTVTFIGVGSSPASVVLSMSAFDTYRNHIINVERTAWWRFTNMTVRNTYSAGLSRCIYIQNSSNNTFSRLVVESSNKTSSVNTNAAFYAAGNKCDSNSLLNCSLSGGSYPVYFLGSSGSRSTRFTMSGCSVSGAPDGGIFIQYARNVNLDSNVVDMAYSTLSTVYGMRLDYCDSNLSVTRNIAKNINSGGIGLRVYYCEGSRVNRALIANNMLSIMGTAANCYGIYSYYSSHCNFLHNSILLSTSTASSYCLGVFGVGTYKTNITNNLFTNRGTGRVMIIQSSGLIEKESYNGLYTTGTTLCVDGATTKANLAQWQAVASTKYGIGDFTGINPTYRSTSDLHLSSGCAMSKATRLSSVLRDLDYQTRDTPTFVGADEVAIKNKDASPVAIVSPANPVTVGSNNIVFTLTNRGYDSLTSVSVAYSINGGTISTATFTLSPALQACASRNITISSVNFGVGRNYFLLYITKLNTTINDQNPGDDTLGYEFCARYSGTYYIDKNKPASSSNFTSFTDAVNKLTNCGVGGPVTIRVVEGSGPYNEIVKLTTAIPGISRINTVTFKGNYLSDTLYYNASTTSDPAVIRISGNSHITIDSLTIINGSSTIGYGILFNNNSDSCTISNCIIKTPQSTGNTFPGICMSGSTAGTGANHGDYTRILNNRIIGSSISIMAYGALTTSMNRNLIIRNNECTDFFMSGIYLRNELEAEITGNTITAATSSSTVNSTVVFFYADKFTFSHNKILRGQLYGIELNNANVMNGNSTNKALISNNFIGGAWRTTGATAIYYNSSSYINVYYNTISMPSGTALTNTFTNSGHQVKNNIFSVHNSNNVVLNWSNSSALDAGGMDYNLYWNNNNASVISVFGSTLTSSTLSSSGHNGNSKYGDPEFVNATSDLHTFGSAANNAAVTITGISTDIDQDSRPFTGTSTDIGADEYSPLALDIGPTQLDGPSAPFTKGSNGISVQLKNQGNNALDSFDVSLYVNDTLKGTSRWYGMLNSGNTTSVSLGSYNFGHGRYKIRVISSNPNGGNDDRPKNDTLTVWVCAALSGTYTINSGAAASSTNYNSMKQALLDCYECGISANVTFNTSSGSGPYYGPVELGVIPGASSGARITLNGANTLFTAATTMTNNAVVRLNGTSYLSINNLRIQSTSVYYAWGIHMMNGASYNHFRECSILLPNVNASNGQNTCGLVYSASRTNPFIAGNNAFRSSFTLGNITSGTAGAATAASLCGGANADTTTGNIFHYNTISNYVYNGIYARYAGGDSISHNIIESPDASLLADRNGISLDSGAHGLRLNANIVRKPFSDTATTYSFNGIRLNQINPAAGKSLQICNNQVYYIRSNGKIKGILMNRSSRFNLLHNSVAIEDNNSASSLQAAGIELSGSGDMLSNNLVKNNLISIKRGGTGSKAALIIANTTASGGNADYNNLYSTGTNAATGVYNGIDYSSITTWKALGLFDQNSTGLNPQYPDLSTGELYPGNPSLDKAGTPLTIKTDGFGNPRNPLKPDVGAVEFSFELRTDTLDYQATASPDLREGHWYQALDDSGKLVLAIKPASGEPLGNLGWKVRILRGVSKVRSMGLYNSPGGDKGWFLNRNFIITPANSPVSQVGVRLYATRQEILDMQSALAAAGKNSGTFTQFVNDSLQVTKYNGPNTDLDPMNGVYSPGVYSLLNPDCDSFSNLSFYALRFNTTSFSEFNPSFIPGKLLPLPLDLLNLKAVWYQPGALVTWDCANPDHYTGYMVQRSFDGMNFSTAGYADAQIGQTSFSYRDLQVSPDKNPLIYYRIAGVSTDGKEEYSRVVKLTAPGQGQVVVAPNPFSGSFSVTLPALTRGMVQTELRTVDGRLVFSGQTATEPGVTTITLKPGTALPPGLYLLNIQYPGGSVNRKVMSR